MMTLFVVAAWLFSLLSGPPVKHLFSEFDHL